MEAVFDAEEFGADAAASGAKTPGVGTSQFESGFPGFGAAVAEEDSVEAADLGQTLGELPLQRVKKEVRCVEEPLALTGNRFFHGRVPVAERGDADATEEIEIVFSAFITEIDALSADKEIRVTLVRLEKQLTLRCLDRCQFHATITSVPSFTLVEQRSGSNQAASAGRMRTRLTP